MRVADLAHRRGEIARRLVESAFALHRLDDDRRDARRVDVGLEQLVQRRERICHRHAMQRDRERAWKTSPGIAPKPTL